MTELVRTHNITGALEAKKTSLVGVLHAANADLANVPPDPQLRGPLPQAPALPATVSDQVDQLADALGELELPSTRRQMTQPELARLTEVYLQLRETLKAFDRSRDQIKTAAFNHFDAVAVEDGRITDHTTYTDEGWAILEDLDSAAVEGLDEKLVRGVARPSLTLTAEDLERAVADGVLTKADFRAQTKRVTVLDEDASLEWIRQNPERAHVLARYARPTRRGSARFEVRSNVVKDDDNS